MRTLLALALSVIATGAVAAEKFPYGSRVGMELDIVSTLGLGTERAVIRVRHTRANARSFCVEYSNDRSAKCVNDMMTEYQSKFKDFVSANCQTGIVTDPFGDKFRFAGPVRRKNEFDIEYELYRGAELMEGSSASGYPVALEQFRILCPGIAP